MSTRPTHYRDGQLTIEQVGIEDIARRHETPVFVYSANSMRQAFRRLREAFSDADPIIAYSVKANTNGAVLRLLAEEGAAFDIVSGGELMRALRAGVTGERVIYAGVGKTPAEMDLALRAGVFEFNVESVPEAELLDRVAGRAGRRAPVALRVNPDVAARTHDYISTGRKKDKFGMSIPRARELAARIGRDLKHLQLVGVHAHVGSQIMDGDAHRAATGVLDGFLLELKQAGAPLKTLNLGGGFGVRYDSDEDTDLEAIARPIVDLALRHGLRLLLEPGRYLVARAGVLIMQVLYRKHSEEKTFAIVDASMTENMRPSLYQAHHDILPVRNRPDAETETVDVVGPVCESTDFLAKDRCLPVLQEGDLLALLDAGAYCAAMGSNYNSRPLAAEVLVDGENVHLIRRRQRIQDLFADEIVPGYLHGMASRQARRLP